MDKRALTAVALSIAVLILWHTILGPMQPAAPQKAQPSGAGSPAPSAGEAGPGATPAAEAASPSAPDPAMDAASAAGSPAEAAAEASEFIVETSAYSIRFTNQGGRVLSWRLLEYVDNLHAPHELVARDAAADEFPLRIAIEGDADATERLDRALYKSEVREASEAEPWPGGGFKGKIVVFSWSDGETLSVRKRLALPEAGYVGRVDVEAKKGALPASFDLTWAVGLPEPAGDDTSVYFHAQGQGVVQVGPVTDRLPAGDGAVAKTYASSAAGALQWGGLESTYFASLLIPEKPGDAAMTFAPSGPKSEGGTPRWAARFRGKGEAGFTSVVGPKDYDLLNGIGRGLEHAIDFSRFSLIYLITKWLFLALRWTNDFAGNYGLSIIILTVVIRAAFFPLTYKSSIAMRQNMKKMQRIQPRVKAIQEKYKKMKKSFDTQREMNDKVMAVYKEEGMNPMGSLSGCLPLLLQMPVFIAFYNLLSVTIELRGAPFVFWIRDLSRMDPYFVSPILMGISWVVQQWMTSSTIPDPIQRRMMYLMPVMFTFMMARMPSGLVIYWLVSNVVGLAQQYVINRQADRMASSAA